MFRARLGLRKAVISFLHSTNCKASAVVLVDPATCGEVQSPSGLLCCLLQGASFVAALGLQTASLFECRLPNHCGAGESKSQMITSINSVYHRGDLLRRNMVRVSLNYFSLSNRARSLRESNCVLHLTAVITRLTNLTSSCCCCRMCGQVGYYTYAFGTAHR